MKNAALVITSIASDENSILRQYAAEAGERKIPFIVMGDKKSPKRFDLKGCDFYPIERQQALGFALADALPTGHYARKNLGYLAAIRNGAEILIETDDDNIPAEGFWEARSRTTRARSIRDGGWVNAYKYFTDAHIWPRGFALEKILEPVPRLPAPGDVRSPIQQGLADGNPDVDAIYRLTLPLPVRFNAGDSVALAENSICPFNSQNTTWFREAFPLLYLPSYCSFRMTDIWRSFAAQRIAWTCGWPILFHASTVRQERNDHSLIKDFEDEVPGYLNNSLIMSALSALPLKGGAENIPENLLACYRELIRLGVVGEEELKLLNAWLKDIAEI